MGKSVLVTDKVTGLQHVIFKQHTIIAKQPQFQVVGKGIEILERCVGDSRVVLWSTTKCGAGIYP